MTKHSDTQTVREIVAAYFDLEPLQASVHDLLEAGFQPETISMLASEYAVREKLGNYYEQVNHFKTDQHAPLTAFVARHSIGDTMHALFGSLYFLGATIAAGAVVATVGATAGAITVAVAGSSAIAGIGAALASIIHESEAEEIEQQIDEGHLVLFVRTDDSTHEKLALSILERHGAQDTRVCNIKPEAN